MEPAAQGAGIGGRARRTREPVVVRRAAVVAEPSSTSLPGTACSWTGAAASPAAGGGSVHSQSAAADAKRGSAAADPEVGGLRSSSRLCSVTRRPDAGQQTSSASCSGRDQRTAHTSAASASALPTTRTQPSSGRSAAGLKPSQYVRCVPSSTNQRFDQFLRPKTLEPLPFLNRKPSMVDVMAGRRGRRN